jgi:RNA polymerase sigma-32 factor
MARADREEDQVQSDSDGAGPSAPAAETETTASSRQRSARAGASKKKKKTKRRATPARKKGETTEKKAQPRKGARPAASAPAREDQDDEGSVPVEAEVVLPESEAGPDDEEEGDDVLDVGVTPSLPGSAASSAASLPARRGTALERFLSEVGRYPVLSPEEERELTLAYYERQDPRAARKLVIHNLRLVVKLAYRYRRAWASVLDLIQEGNVGLVEAVQRFDPFKGAKFSTYATFWIRAYMLRYLLEHSRTVRISRTRVGRKLFFQLAKERAKLQAQGIDPGPKLLAERLGVDQAELENVVRHMDQAEVRLDAPIGDEGTGGTVLDAMTSEGLTPEAEAYRREFSSDISRAFDEFAQTLTDPREQAAWNDHLMSEDPTSLSELGKQFGVTKQRMGQIVTGLRKRLREHLIQALGPDVELGFQLEGE